MTNTGIDKRIRRRVERGMGGRRGAHWCECQRRGRCPPWRSRVSAAPAGVSTVSVLTGVNRVPHGDVVDKSVMGCYSYKSDNGQAAP